MDFNVTKAGTSTATVTSVLTLELIDAEGTTTPLETEFSFDPADPLERERALVEYRAAAAGLVLACQEALGRY